MPLLFEEKFAPGSEIEALEFLNACPIEWRLVFADGRSTPWRPGDRAGSSPVMRTFWDLQEMRGGVTCGIAVDGCTLETRGFGAATVFFWPRDGKCKPLPNLTVLKGAQL